jgi:hypothetical protein
MIFLLKIAIEKFVNLPGCAPVFRGLTDHLGAGLIYLVKAGFLVVNGELSTLNFKYNLSQPRINTDKQIIAFCYVSFLF